MTILSTGAYDFPAAADRNRNSMMLEQQGTSALGVIDGVHAGLALTKTTGMGFQIGPGRAAINGTTATEGTFTCAVTAPEIGAFEPGEATMDRVDLVVLKTYPANPSATGVKVEVIKGTPFAAGGASPVVTAPAGSLALFAVRINAGISAANGGWDTAKVTDRRRAIGVPDFIDYTPTWGNFANLGSGFVSRGRYRVDGDKVSLNVHLQGGAGAVIGNHHLLNFTLPIPAKDNYVYYGLGGLHHPTQSGLAYDLRVLSTVNAAVIHATNSDGSLGGPGSKGYPFAQGTVIFANLEYFIDLQ